MCSGIHYSRRRWRCWHDIKLCPPKMDTPIRIQMVQSCEMSEPARALAFNSTLAVRMTALAGRNSELRVRDLVPRLRMPFERLTNLAGVMAVQFFISFRIAFESGVCVCFFACLAALRFYLGVVRVRTSGASVLLRVLFG